MNIVLIGFMGSGKTAVGIELAKKMQMEFIDLDQRISHAASMTIPEIFKKYGEGHFRRLEADEVVKLGKATSAVIATGGGVVLNPGNIELLKKTGIVVLLDATAETVYNRIGADTNRPLLKGDKAGRMKTIKRLMKERNTIYKGSCSFQVDTSRLHIRNIVQIIISRIRTSHAKG